MQLTIPLTFIFILLNVSTDTENFQKSVKFLEQQFKSICDNNSWDIIEPQNADLQEKNLEMRIKSNKTFVATINYKQTSVFNKILFQTKSRLIFSGREQYQISKNIQNFDEEEFQLYNELFAEVISRIGSVSKSFKHEKFELILIEDVKLGLQKQFSFLDPLVMTQESIFGALQVKMFYKDSLIGIIEFKVKENEHEYKYDFGYVTKQFKLIITVENNDNPLDFYKNNKSKNFEIDMIALDQNQLKSVIADIYDYMDINNFINSLEDVSEQLEVFMNKKFGNNIDITKRKGNADRIGLLVIFQSYKPQTIIINQQYMNERNPVYNISNEQLWDRNIIKFNFQRQKISSFQQLLLNKGVHLMFEDIAHDLIEIFKQEFQKLEIDGLECVSQYGQKNNSWFKLKQSSEQDFHCQLEEEFIYKVDPQKEYVIISFSGKYNYSQSQKIWLEYYQRNIAKEYIEMLVKSWSDYHFEEI